MAVLRNKKGFTRKRDWVQELLEDIKQRDLMIHLSSANRLPMPLDSRLSRPKSFCSNQLSCLYTRNRKPILETLYCQSWNIHIG